MKAIWAAQIYKIGTDAGMTRDEVDAIARNLGHQNVTHGIDRGARGAIERAVTIAAREAREAAAEVIAEAEKALQGEPMATPKQVDYIMQLLAKRGHDGVGGGFMTGPTTREEVRKMTKADASLYIDSLTERY